MDRTRKDLQTVCVWDPAIDWPRSDLSRYVMNRDVDALTFRKGEAPAVYHLRAIPNRFAIDHLFTEENQIRRRRLAFQLSVIRVDHARVRTDESRSNWRPENVQQNRGSKVPLNRIPFLVSDDELEMFEPAAILEIGEVAHSRAFLPRSISGGFVLPPSSWRLLEVVRDLYAARIRKALGEIGDLQSPEGQKSGEPSEPLGNAHAMEGAMEETGKSTPLSTETDHSSTK